MTLKPPPFLEILRPRQWLKNAIVLAGLAFALPDKQRPDMDVMRAALDSAAAFALFCVVSSAVYIMNDLHDADEDRAHPRKRLRPVASGRLGAHAARLECALLAAAAAAGACFCGRAFAAVLGVYALMQAAYTFALKKVVLADVFVIALGFVARVYGGAAAAGVPASSWILLCTFSIALFMALCKRYDERTLLGEGAALHRKVLARYEPRFLAHMISASAAVTIMFYAIYTVSPATAAKFGGERLAATVPFVVFGIFRYAYLVLCEGKGGRPEHLVTTDAPLIVNFIAYAAAAAAALWAP